MAEPLKNMFNTQFMARLAQAVQGEYVAFESGLFVSRVFDDTWEGRELKDRTRHIVNCLHATLPDGYCPALEVLRAAALSPLLADYDYETMIFPDFVEAYGLDDWQASIPAMEQFTQQAVLLAVAHGLPQKASSGIQRTFDDFENFQQLYIVRRFCQLEATGGATNGADKTTPHQPLHDFGQMMAGSSQQFGNLGSRESPVRLLRQQSHRMQS